MDNINLCPCCSGVEFDKCCKNIVEGVELAKTPLALMRSRYVAHVLKNVDHIVRTMIDKSGSSSNNIEMRDDFDKCVWTKLEIIDAPFIGVDSLNGIVEFKAYYTSDGINDVLHDRSIFIKKDNKWYYVFDSLTDVKLGRNDPCSCGSGKKYKKCCLSKAG